MPNYAVYACADAKYIALGTLEPKFWGKFCDLQQQPNWKMYMVPQTEAQRQAYKAEIGALFAQKTQKEWVNWGMENDLLISPVYDLPDLEDDPHLQARQMIVTVEHPKAGTLKGVGVPLKFSETQAQPAWAAPLLGEDTEAILKELGLASE
jgi:alpha-methylacyl-CoA racemase